MALQLRRLAAALGYPPQQVRALSQLGFGACYSSIASSDSSDYGVGAEPQDFQRSFHKSASIDPTAFVEFGAVVHSKSVVGEHVCIGSGAVIGPGVSAEQSTKIGKFGLSFLFICIYLFDFDRVVGFLISTATMFHLVIAL